MEPPPLGYDLASKRTSIAINVAGIVVCSVLIPVILYYSLEYWTRINQVLIITVAQLSMLAPGVQIIYRWWQLLRNDGERAPRNRTKWTLDNFQWQLIFGTILVSTVSITASIIGSILLFTISYLVLFANIAIQLVLTAWMSRAGIRVPFRVSSQPPGAVIRPLLYTAMEDLTACDGAGGVQYRDRANERYAVSPPFQELTYKVSLSLGITFLIVTVIDVMLLAIVPEHISFGVSMVLLWGWSGVSGWLSMEYTRRALVLEKEWWKQKFLGNEMGRAN